MTDFRWDEKTQRFRRVLNGKLGSFVSKQDVDNLVKDAIAQQQQNIDDTTQQLIDGKIKLSTFEASIAAALKDITINQFALGKGGVGRLNQSDYGKIGAQLKFQYRKLRQFSLDILRGKVSQQQAINRSRAYFNKTRESFEAGRLAGHRSNGFNYEKRIRRATESCAECIAYESAGWQAIGSLPSPCSKCTCMSNCKCEKVYSVSKPDNYFSKTMGILDISEFEKTITLKREGDRLLAREGEESEWEPLNDFLVPTGNVVIPSSGVVTPSQLEKINVFVPDGFDKFTADEVFSVTAIAADNLVNRSYTRWDVDSLRNMARLIVGKPALYDHDSFDVGKKTWGFIYDAQHVRTSTADDELIDAISMGDFNREIIAREGLNRVYFQAFTTVDDTQLIEMVRSRKLKGISTGGFRFTDFLCPVCDTSIRNPKCHHYIRSPWSDFQSDEIAPYVTRSGLFDICEASLVSCPNLPGATIV